MNKFLAIRELHAQQSTAINFRDRTNVKYFMKHNFSDFIDTTKVSSVSLLKITIKSTRFLLAKKKIPILWIELQTNKVQKVSEPYI